jgi:hypothetical protein
MKSLERADGETIGMAALSGRRERRDVPLERVGAGELASAPAIR